MSDILGRWDRSVSLYHRSSEVPEDWRLRREAVAAVLRREFGPAVGLMATVTDFYWRDVAAEVLAAADTGI